MSVLVYKNQWYREALLARPRESVHITNITPMERTGDITSMSPIYPTITEYPTTLTFTAEEESVDTPNIFSTVNEDDPEPIQD